MNRNTNYYYYRACKTSGGEYKAWISRIQFPVATSAMKFLFLPPSRGILLACTVLEKLRGVRARGLEAVQLGRSLSWPRWMSRDVSPLDLPFQLRRDVDYRGDDYLPRAFSWPATEAAEIFCVCRNSRRVACFVEEDAPWWISRVLVLKDITRGETKRERIAPLGLRFFPVLPCFLKHSSSSFLCQALLFARLFSRTTAEPFRNNGARLLHKSMHEIDIQIFGLEGVVSIDEEISFFFWIPLSIPRFDDFSPERRKKEKSWLEVSF